MSPATNGMLMTQDQQHPRRDLFTSRRECGLWIATAVVLVAIFSTLALARTLAEQLSGLGLGVWLFVLCCFLVLASVVTQGLKARPRGLEIAVLLGVAAAYILVFVRMSIPSERSHLIEYGVVAIFIHEALSERRRNARRVPMPAILAFILASLIGAMDEGIQLFLPSRVFDWMDILFNSLAALMAIATSGAIGWARRYSTRQRK